MESLLYAAGAVTVLGGAVVVVRQAVGWMIRTARKLSRLADDLLGEPAHGGMPARPGLMERVAGIEATQADMLGRLAGLEELRPNGGGSIKDTIGRIAQATGANQT